MSVLRDFYGLRNTPLDAYTMLVHSEVDGHVGSCHFLAILSNAAVNICVQFFHLGIHFPFSLAIYLDVELMGLMVTLCLIF